MDIQQLKRTHQKLLDHLETYNYNKTYIKEVKNILDTLLDKNQMYNPMRIIGITL